MASRVRAFAPATIANLGPGFDVLGLALAEPGDLVEAELSDTPGIEIVEVTGDGGALSRDARRNVAGVSAHHLLDRLRHEGHAGVTASTGIRMRVHKQMPIASGLGSSAASAVAGAVAVNALFGQPFEKEDLLASALEGERAASGSTHADNVAPSLLGGLLLMRSYHPLEIVRLPSPPALWVAVVHPHHEVPTAAARALVQAHNFSLDRIVSNLGNLAALVSALYSGDLDLLGRAIDDQLIEPVRAPLIPGFGKVKLAALEGGALGCSIAGAGPSVFALCAGRQVAEKAAEVMRAAFATHASLSSDVYISQVNQAGATVIS